MSWSMTRALVWKEWRESRLKFLALLGAFHLPLIGFVRAAYFLKRPEHDLLAFKMAEQHNLYATLFYQSAFAMTIGLFLVAFFGASAFAWDYEGNRVFFIFERPVSRAWFLSVKWTVYAAEALVSACVSLFTTQLFVYFFYNAEGSPVLAISEEQLTGVLQASVRGALWLAALGLGAFAWSFFFGAWFQKWWTALVAGGAAVGVFLALMYFRIYGWMLLRFTHETPVSIDRYAQLQALPLVLLLLAVVAAFAAAQYVFRRREIW